MFLLRSLEGLWLSHFPGRVPCSPAPGPAAFGRGQLLSCKSWGTHGLCLFLYGKEFPLCSWLCLAARGGTRTSSRRLSLVLFWAGVGCQGMVLHWLSPSSYFRKGIWRRLWFAQLFTLLCSQEPEKSALQAVGNNSRRIQSLHNTIFQTLSVFESYVLFSLRRKEFPSVSAWETTWLPHLRQIFQSGSNQTVTMSRGTCYSSHVDLGLPQESAPALGTLVAVAARQLLGTQFFVFCCLVLLPHTDSGPSYTLSLLSDGLQHTLAFYFAFLHFLIISLPSWAHLMQWVVFFSNI